jgi:biofilm PGA synthesis protein PgaD
MPKIIIEDKPELLGKARARIELVFTTLMWALWIYLFIPMLTIVLWFAGLHYIYHTVVEPAVLTHVKEMLMRLGLFILIVFIVLRGWGYYNYYAFGKLNRRKNSKPIGPAELAEHFGLPEQRVRLMQNEKEIVLSKTDDGFIESQRVNGELFTAVSKQTHPGTIDAR